MESWRAHSWAASSSSNSAFTGASPGSVFTGASPGSVLGLTKRGGADEGVHLPPSLMTMLALLARDADSHELEHQLKQDPALSYHLLKLVNSAAFTSGVPIMPG